MYISIPNLIVPGSCNGSAKLLLEAIALEQHQLPLTGLGDAKGASNSFTSMTPSLSTSNCSTSFWALSRLICKPFIRSFTSSLPSLKSL